LSKYAETAQKAANSAVKSCHGCSPPVSSILERNSNQIKSFISNRAGIQYSLTFMEIDVNRYEYEHNSINFLQFYCINNTQISVRRRQVSHSRLCLVLAPVNIF
jgi:hypothetical protein